MADTLILNQVAGTWALWVRTRIDPATATYTAVFTPSGTDPSQGTVTVQVGPASYSGPWKQKEDWLDEDENVSFSLQDPSGSGDELHFSGHLVGAAMGGTTRHKLNPLFGAWAASKTSDGD